MKAYIPYETEDTHFMYPEDMAKILAYLNLNGILHVKDKTVERLYRQFSDDCYAAGWMDATDECIAEFADWLSELDI